jgi:L-ascorbate metabolism protein UlaG (beta-lactamase superfamily)
MNGSKNKVSLAWLGQMGLRINVNETTILVDYFASVYPERRTIPPIAAEAVRGVDAFLGTHDHLDHIDHSAWRIWASTCPDARFVFPSTHRQSVLNDGIPTKRMLPIDAGQHVQVGDIIIHAIPAAHEFLFPDGTGHYPCLQYIIEGGGRRIYHAGDTLRYEGMLYRLQAFGHIDAAIVPINGRDGTRYRGNCMGNMTFQEAADLAGELRPGLVIPGHWDMFADNPGDPEAFADYLDAKYGDKIPCHIPRILEEIEL